MEQGIAGVALVFPGQGSQKVGMGRSWAEASPEARRTFEEADEVLGFALSRLCWEGPEEELNLTVNTQPALLATSVAIHRALAGMGAPAWVLAPRAVAGHSLGEYSALVAAGALGFADALRLVRRRGQAMQDAVPVGQGAMAAIIGLDDETCAAIAAEASQSSQTSGGEVCVVANYNSPGQVALAGHTGAIDRAVELARARGARKATLLPVSAPFHSPLMRPARDAMAGPLAAVAFADPRVPVVANVDAAPVATGDAARDALVRQIDGPVRWVESVRWMRETAGAELFLEMGPGNVLSGLVRRIVPGTRVQGLAEPEQLRKLLAGPVHEPAAAEERS
jgi:[acyl-carrier-protein] S-malonyltransferase